MARGDAIAVMDAQRALMVPSIAVRAVGGFAVMMGVAAIIWPS